MGIYQEAELLGHMIDNSMFKFFRAVKLFQSSYTIFTSHQKQKRIPVSPHSHQDLSISFYCLALLVGVKWYLITTLSFRYQF